MPKICFPEGSTWSASPPLHRADTSQRFLLPHKLWKQQLRYTDIYLMAWHLPIPVLFSQAHRQTLESVPGPDWPGGV